MKKYSLLQRAILINLILMCCVMIGGCHRNQFSLPDPQLASTFDTTIGFGSQRQLALHFIKKGFAGRDSLLLSVQNVSSVEYKSLSIYLDIVSARPGNYNDVLFHKVLNIATLEAGATSQYVMVASDTTLPLSGHLIAGILSYEGSTHPLAGDYSNIKVEFCENDTVRHHGQVQGYIFDNGESLFRLHQLDVPAGYSILSGIFTDTSYFDGQLIADSSRAIFTTALDSLPSGLSHQYDEASKKLTFRLKLQNPSSDSINRITITVRKN